MRRIVAIIFMLMSVYCACAQQTDEDYYLYKIDAEREMVEMINSDTALFYRLGRRSGDLYGEVTDYKFSFVDFARRGLAYYERGVWLDGVAVEYNEVPTLRRLGLMESRYSGVTVSENTASMALLRKLGYADLGYSQKVESQVFGKWLQDEDWQ